MVACKPQPIILTFLKGKPIQAPYSDLRQCFLPKYSSEQERLQVYDLLTGFRYLDFTELEFVGGESDSWRWMFDDYYGYLTNQKTWGVLTQEGETVVLVPQLSYNEPDPSQQWTLDYNGLTQSA